MSARTPTTGADGRATFVYEAPTDVTAARDVTVTTSFGDGAARQVHFDLSVTGSTTGAGGGTGTGGDGPGDADRPPSVAITDVEPDQPGGIDRVTVSATATDADADLATLEYELRGIGGTVIDRTTLDVAGASATESATLAARGQDRRDAYRVVVTATDAAGR